MFDIKIKEKASQQSPLVEKPKDILSIDGIYKQDERDYISALQGRLEKARDQRDASHEEFDDMSYLKYYESNLQAANTYVAAKKNEEDTNFRSGTVADKIDKLLAVLNNYNLAADIQAFDTEQREIQSLGDSLEDIFEKCNEWELDEEKRIERQRELLVQGDCFVEERWIQDIQVDKTPTKPFTGAVASADWVTKQTKKLERPEKEVIPGRNVYLGDITCYPISKQPYIFTVENKSYAETQKIYGNWERWKYVSKTLKEWQNLNNDSGIYSNNWVLRYVQPDQCEIIKYQDKWSNEYQVIINGVMMLPIGFPLVAVSPSGEYSLTQQGLIQIHKKFAYHKGLPAKIKTNVAILDEMLRMAILKTQKSFAPPYINNSGMMVSRRVFMPGKITHGIPKGSLQPIHDHEITGVTNSEMAMIQELYKNADQNTYSQTFGGQVERGQQTATQIREVSKQAKMTLGLTITMVALLEKKLVWLRLPNILQHWFDPEDTVVDKVKKVLSNKYRSISVAKSFSGKGKGRKIIQVSDVVPTPDEIYREEEFLSKREGRPVRKVYLPTNLLELAKITWSINVVPRDKRTSEFAKVDFDVMARDMLELFGQDANISYLEELFAETWDIPFEKAFKPGNAQMMAQNQITGANTPKGRGNSPKINMSLQGNE